MTMPYIQLNERIYDFMMQIVTRTKALNYLAIKVFFFTIPFGNHNEVNKLDLTWGTKKCRCKDNIKIYQSSKKIHLKFYKN